MKPLSYQELEGRIDECMLADRFSMRRQLKKKKERERLARSIDKSIGLVEKRKGCVPEVTLPKALPVAQQADDILQLVRDHQVVVVAGETGSGKTTQLPKLCLMAGRGVYGRIGHTQPRRVAARTIAHRLAEELDVNVGREVGYQVRFKDESGPLTLIKVMTDGVLLAETQSDRFLERYDTIIIDEAHERSLNIDFLLGYIKRILPKRPDLKVIITSATIDVERFSRHFNNAPVIEVSGRTYPVDVHYRPLEENDDDEDSLTRGILDVLDEIESLPKGDVLIFLPGEREIRETAREIKHRGPKGFEILPLYSRLGVAEQNRVFAAHSQRRIVLATNVAETSLTVPGIRYVIDPGLARVSRYSVRSKVQQLPIEAVSQASANQRMGRCGRISDGVCFRLYSEEDFAERPAFTEPEILRTNLAAVILQMLQLKLGDMTKFPFVERPNPKQINDGFALLYELGAVSRNRQITKLGKKLTRFPIDLKFARMILAADQAGSLNELLILAAGMTIQDPRERPFDHQQASDNCHKQYWDEKSDFIALINLWASYEEQRQALSQGQLRKYCRQNFLSFIRMREWREIHRQLVLISRELGLKFNRNPAEYNAVHRALMTGLLGQIAEKTGEHEYTGARNRKQYIFPGSSQFSRKPRWILSSELVETSRLFARNVAEIDRSWIEPIAGHLVQRSYHDPEFSQDRGQVVAREEVRLYGLVIVSNRLVDFGTVDTSSAREIFIEKGLVEGLLKTRLKFFQHNRRLIRDIQKLESKARKRDILIENRVLYEFYDQMLPQDVTSEFDLTAFVAASSKNDRKLKLTREELMRREADLSLHHFPDRLEVGTARLPLRYKFEPGSGDDGVTVDVPVVLLNQVPRAQLDWVVPGLLREKCLALVKSLPKSIRKNFVPAPDYVDRVLEDFEFSGKPLVEALADKLFRLSGTRVSPDDFQPDGLDRHLALNIRVVNAKGKVLARGRNLDDLVDELGESVATELQQRDAHTLEQAGLTDWTFGDLPASVQLERSGIAINYFPALVDEGDSVAIQLIESAWRANKLSQQGLLKLYLLRLQDQYKYLSANIPGFDGFAIYFATRGPASELKHNIVSAVFHYELLEDKPPVRDQQTFEARLEWRKGLFDCLQQVARLTGTALKQANEIELALGQRPAQLQADVRRQLNGLFPRDFPAGIPFAGLRQYPRYLKGIQHRLERYQGHRDEEAMAELTPLLDRWDALEEEDKGRLQKFRWMLEEFRVSLFAQSIGTTMRVSGKRLEKEWESVMGRRK